MSNKLPFPFELPTSSVVYVLLYVLTLAIHIVFMNYVLAGTIYMAAMTLFPRLNKDNSAISMSVLKDWMPFFISAAITAGIAPLLFVQILYQKEFYTANLLLFHRWMAILPALIVGFYLTYLLKSHFLEKRHRFFKIIVAVGAVACFFYTAFAWTENYSLSIRATEDWSDFYWRGRMYFLNLQVINRLMIWVTSAFPTMVVVLAWQLWYFQRQGREVPRIEMRRAVVIAVAGWIMSILLMGSYYQSLDELVQLKLSRKYEGTFYLIAAIVGAVVSIGSWILQWRHWRFKGACLTGATIGSLVTLISVSMMRELLRVAQLGMSRHFDSHVDEHIAYGKVGGLTVFLGFFVSNAILIAVCFLLVRRGKLAVKSEEEGTIDPPSTM